MRPYQIIVIIGTAVSVSDTWVKLRAPGTALGVSRALTLLGRDMEARGDCGCRRQNGSWAQASRPPALASPGVGDLSGHWCGALKAGEACLAGLGCVGTTSCHGGPSSCPLLISQAVLTRVAQAGDNSLDKAGRAGAQACRVSSAQPGMDSLQDTVPPDHGGCCPALSRLVPRGFGAEMWTLFALSGPLVRRRSWGAGREWRKLRG